MDLGTSSSPIPAHPQESHLASLHVEVTILRRLLYKNQNQHRRAKYWRALSRARGRCADRVHYRRKARGGCPRFSFSPFLPLSFQARRALVALARRGDLLALLLGAEHARTLNARAAAAFARGFDAAATTDTHRRRGGGRRASPSPSPSPTPPPPSNESRAESGSSLLLSALRAAALQLGDAAREALAACRAVTALLAQCTFMPFALTALAALSRCCVLCARLQRGACDAFAGLRAHVAAHDAAGVPPKLPARVWRALEELESRMELGGGGGRGGRGGSAAEPPTKRARKDDSSSPSSAGAGAGAGAGNDAGRRKRKGHPGSGGAPDSGAQAPLSLGFLLDRSGGGGGGHQEQPQLGGAAAADDAPPPKKKKKKSAKKEKKAKKKKKKKKSRKDKHDHDEIDDIFGDL